MSKRTVLVSGWVLPVAVAAALGGLAACDGTADVSGIEQTAQPAFGNGSGDTGKYYRLRSVSSNLCLDVEGKSSGNGVRVLQFNCSAGENQQWYFRQLSDGNQYQLSAKHSAKCLRVDGGSAGDNAILEQDPCARSGGGFNGTRFTVTQVGSTTPPRYQLVTQTAGKCVQSPSASSGVPVVQNPCAQSTNFLFTLEEQPTPAQSDANGRWSAVATLPLVPAAAALLPNRKVLTWSSWKAFRFGGSGSLDQTMVAVVDPANPGAATGKLITNTVHNMFCPGTAMLSDGRVFVNGGDDSYTKTTSIYNWNNDTWSTGKAMIEARWYNTSVTLPDGRVLTIGGNRTSGQSGTAEIWNPANNTWSLVPNLVMGPLTSGQPGDGRPEEHPRLLIAPNGRIFVPGPTTNMQWYDFSGSGAVIAAGKRGNDEFSQNDITVMFDVGKILKAGGNPNYDRPNARFSPSSQASYVIDINGGGTAAVSEVGPMKYPRAFGNGVVLANGQVLAVGGLDNAKGFSDDGAVKVAELFNPATGTWTELAPMVKPRPYHSIALLLTDGRVMVGGGGLCSSSDNCAVNHPDVEIFSPPYLFGTPRPTITNAPTTITANGSTFSVTTTGTVTGFSLVRMASVTHSTNTDQRFQRLQSSGSGTFTVTAPLNKNIAPPGYYMLFALNNNTPSVAAVVRVQ
jgi:galactose oxidase